MRVCIAREILDTSDSDTIATLDAIFSHFLKKRHLWGDLREIEDTRFRKKLPERLILIQMNHKTIRYTESKTQFRV